MASTTSKLKKLLTEFKYWSRAFNIGWRISILSILAIGIIGLLVWLDQGSTLILDMIDHRPFNLLLFWIFLWGIREIVSHYPTYIDKWRIHRNQVLHEDFYDWKIDYSGFGPRLQKILKWWKGKGLGFITYDLRELTDPKEKELWEIYNRTVHKKVDLIRRLLGLVLIALVVYSIARCWVRQLYPDMPQILSQIWWALLLGLIGIFFGIHHFARKAQDNPKIKRWGKIATLVALYLGYLLKGFSVIAGAIWGWSFLTNSVIVIALVVELFSFCLFKNFRKYFNRQAADYEALPLEPRYMSDYTRYLLLIGLTGMLGLGVILTSHFFLFAFTPIVIILAYVHLFYGLFIIPAKHYFYYVSAGEKRYRFPKIFIPSVPIFLLLYAILAGRWGNDLHLLPLYNQEPEKTVNFDTFVRQMHESFDSTDTVYFIASYGGGLKANVWNMLVLNELTHRYQENIVEHTLAMSGVSGGALGIAFFSALYHQHPGKDEESYEQRKAIIRKMGVTNMLSMDVTYALGADFVRELWPFKGELRPDRAKIAMEEYGKIVEGNEHDTSLDTTTFQNYWYQLFNDQVGRDAFYPLLLINSAGTHIQRGISCSVDLGIRFDSVFHDAIDLTHFTPVKDKSLSYLHATSTSNRFPIASPAAKIEGKGHFLDGGYFENSGMLSLLDFYTYLKQHSTFLEGKKVQFIQINNDRYNVIHDEFGRQLNGDVLIKEEAELSAVVGTATSISMLPNYLQRFMESHPNVDFSNIHLPYLLTETNVESYRKSKSVSVPDDPKFKTYNDTVRAMLKTADDYERIEPPLARLLGSQAVRYMELAIEKDFVFEELEGGKYPPDKK